MQLHKSDQPNGLLFYEIEVNRKPTYLAHCAVRLILFL